MDLDDIESLTSSYTESSQPEDKDENKSKLNKEETKDIINKNLDRGFIESSNKCK